jgi:SAM-dependent methyltransferase
MKKDFYAEYYEIENVHWWFMGRWHIFTNLVQRELTHRSGEIKALDVGCGTVTWLGRLEAFGSAFGVDCAAEAVEFCRNRGRDGVVQGLATGLPFDDESFDLVCALDLLEHVSDDVATLEEFGRVCSPDGRILITVPAYDFLWGRQDEIAHHLRRYTARELQVKVQAAGLVMRKLTYFDTLLFPLITSIRLGRRLFPRSKYSELKSDFTMTQPGTLNDLLAAVFRRESAIVSRISMPFGVSILAVASKPGVDSHNL